MFCWGNAELAQADRTAVSNHCFCKPADSATITQLLKEQEQDFETVWNWQICVPGLSSHFQVDADGFRKYTRTTQY